MEKRKTSALHTVSVRSVENSGKKYIEGLIPYDSKSVPMFGTTEIIQKGAFNRAVSGKETVLALCNHDDSHVLGSTVSGTLILEDSDAGLVCKCSIPNTTYANDLYEIVSRGDVRTMSFGFYPETWEYNSDKKMRILKDVHLDEVSFGVSFPAYPETSSDATVRKVRKLFKRSIDVASINAILEKEALTDEDKETIKALIAELQSVIGEAKTEPEPDSRTDEEGEEAKETEELTLLETALELEILDLEEIKEEVEEKKAEEEAA